MVDRIELRTERLLLRPFQTGDIADAMEYRDDPEFVRYLSHIPQPFTKQNAKAFVEQNMSEAWDISPTFAVVFSGKLIGTVNLQVSRETWAAMLGYAIGRKWWSLGIATEATTAVIAWGIETFKLTRIWASTDVRHVKSQRVMEKLGMKRELVLTSRHRGRNGEFIDEVVFGLDLSR